MFIVLCGIAQNRRTKSVALEFGDGMSQCLGKSALADGACKDR